MNSNRQFDEHIREQFSGYTPDVHPRIWERIIAEKDKKRPAGFWVSMFNGRNPLLFLGLIIALSSGGAWFYINKHSDSKNTLTKLHNKNAPGDHSGRLTTTSPADEVEAVPENTGIAAITTGENATPTNRSLVSKGSIKTDISAPALQTGEDPQNNMPAGNKKQYTGLGNILVNTTAPELTEDEYAGQGTLLGRLSFNAEKITLQRSVKKPEPLHFNPVVYLPRCPGVEKDAAGNKKYVEFYGGPDYAFRSLHDTGNSAYLQKRKESTGFKSGFSAGVRYTRVFNNSMSIRGGINFSQINEKFKYNQGNVVQVTYIINTNGDTIGSYTTTGSRYKTTINRYRSIDIPIVVGYEVGNGKLHANINAGAMINIYSWQNGDMLDMAGNPVSITTGKGSSPYQFKTNAGIGFIGAVSVYYKLNERLHIMAEPYFRYNLSQMNKETITLKQKYQTAGLRLGIRLDLK